MPGRRQLDDNRVIRPHLPSDENDTHHAGLAYDGSVCASLQNSGEKTWLEAIELHARIAQSRDLDDCLRPQVQTRSLRQAEEIHASRRHILTHVARSDGEPHSLKLIVQLGVNEVDLPQVGLCRIALHPRNMFDRQALVRVRLYTEPRDEPDARPRSLRERVAGASAHRDHPSRNLV